MSDVRHLPVTRVAEAGVLATFVLLIVLAFDRTIQIQFTLPKLAALQLGAAALAVLWAFRLRAGLVNQVPRIILIPSLMLVAWWGITTVFAADASVAVHGMRGRYNGLINQSIFIGIFLALASVQAARREWRGLVAILVLALVPVAAYAIAQNVGLDRFVWPNPRPGSTIGHPVPLAALLGMAIPFVIAFLLTARDSNVRWAWLTVLAMFLFATAATLSRGPWLGAMVASAVVMGAAMRERIVRLNAPAVWIAAAASVAAVAVLWDSTLIARVSLRLQQVAALGADPSFAGRFIYYDAALRMLLDHPLLGVGLENYGVLYPQYRSFEGETIPPDAIPTMVHNGYLQAAATTGVPGLLLYLTVVAAVVLVVARGLKRLKNGDAVDQQRDWLVGVAFVGAILGYLVQDLSGWQEISLSAYFWTFAGAAVAYCGARRSDRPNVPPRWRGISFFAVALPVAGLMVLTLQSWRAMQIDRVFFQSHLADPVRDWARIQENLGVGLPMVGDDSYYLDAAGVLYLKRFHATGERGAYDRAVTLFNRARQLNLRDPYIVFHRIDLETAAIQRGIATDPVGMGPVLSIAWTLDPNNATTHETIARFRVAEQKFDAAMPLIEKAIVSRPRHPRYRALKGDALRGLGNLQGAINAYRKESALLTKGSTDWLNVEHRLMVTMAEAGRHADVLTEGGDVLAQSPVDDVTHKLVAIARQALAAPGQR
jgi:O-antigen ligase